MKIGIDARMYGSEQGGLGRYVEELIKHLEMLETSHEFYIFLRAANWHKYSPSKPNFHRALADIPWYGLPEQLQWPIILYRAKLDLVHFPHWNVPLLYRRPLVVTIHDLIMFHYPRPEATTHGRAMYWFKDRAHRAVVRQAARLARRIITPSNFSKQDIATVLSIPAEKISVVPIAPYCTGAAAHRGETGLGASDETTPRTLGQHGITKPYVLYVGASYPHKNLPVLLDAWKRFQRVGGNTYQLVLAGKKNYFYERLLASTAYRQAQNVTYAGYVTDTELETLYRQAALYVFPSLYEGFGLPPLEAMAHGVPVLAARASCLPEIIGSGARYFDPHDAPALAAALKEILSDPAERERLREAGYKICSTYSWYKTARETLAIYSQALAGG